MARTGNTQVAAYNMTDEDFREKLQNFAQRLNSEPNASELRKTPDGKANSLPISFIEMTLDEYFFGLWSTENFKWSTIANEIVGSIDLIVLNPVSGMPLKRVGAASIQIMVNKGTDALDVNNKKPNALDMGFPKLKAECTKNAAQSLGKLFGRDINRQHADTFNGIFKKSPVPLAELKRLYNEKQELVPPDKQVDAERIIANHEENSFNKLYNYLQRL